MSHFAPRSRHDEHYILLNPFVFLSTVCPHAMDLVLALDSSTDVADEQWKQQKDFMKKVADGFQVQEASTHAGVVAYSTIPSINMKLGERNVKEEVDKAITDLPRDPGNRNLVSNIHKEKS